MMISRFCWSDLRGWEMVSCLAVVVSPTVSAQGDIARFRLTKRQGLRMKIQSVRRDWTEMTDKKDKVVETRGPDAREVGNFKPGKGF
jgi:hypothetical protein